MKKVKSYKDFVNDNSIKEEIDWRKGLVGAGIASHLLTASPAQSKTVESPISQQQVTQEEINEPQVYKDRISQISEIRKQKVTDEKLSMILGEIQSSLDSKDSEKFTKLFTELSSHIESNYGYIIPEKKVEEHFSEGNIIDMAKNMSLFEILGWLGSICLAICGIPQAWQSYKEKNSDGISWGFILLWAFGEIFALAYVYDKLDLPLLLNYATNILILAVILYYKIKPSNKFVNESVEAPGPKTPGSVSIELDDKQISMFSNEPELEELIADQKICLLPPMVWYKEDDKDTLEILKSYIQ